MSEDIILLMEKFENTKKYWLEKLAGEINEIRLPRDKTCEIGCVKEEYNIAFDEDVSSRLQSLSKNIPLSLYVFLLSAFKIVIQKYTNQRDIIVASPVLTDGTQQFTKYVAFRDILNDEMSFRDVVMNVKKTVSEGYKNQHYPYDKLTEQLNIDKEFSLVRVVMLMENIHNINEFKDIVNSSENDITLSIISEENKIHGKIIYNSNIFTCKYIETLFKCYTNIIKQAIAEINSKIGQLELVDEEEKSKIINSLNTMNFKYPDDKTLHELFEEQEQKTPDRIAVSCPIDMKPISKILKSDNLNDNDIKQLENICMATDKYFFKCNMQVEGSSQNMVLLKSYKHNSILVNNNVMSILECLNGKLSIRSIYELIKSSKASLVVYSIDPDDLLEISYKLDNNRLFVYDSSNYEDFIKLIKILFVNNIINVTGNVQEDYSLFTMLRIDLDSEFVAPQKTQLDELFMPRKDLKNADVLLLGDTPGMSTVGLLYLGSYLKRNGFSVYCQFNDSNVECESFKKHIVELLNIIKPKYVGVSMKWFPHIARVIETCKIVKEYSKDIKVVVGGNSASYYSKEVIGFDCVDYVIKGDGELPWLKICQQADYLPNCVYKKDGQIIDNPITYIQDSDNSDDIYLSNLDDILISKNSPLLGTFFIYTNKGCVMNCHYCASCKDGMEKTFKRTKIHRRGIEQVRNDIIQAKDYISTFMFDFDASNEQLLEYCKQMWEGIDLTSHFCTFCNLIAPSPELLEYINKTFKFVYWELDIASLSQRHRKYLQSINEVKPQPTDAEIIKFFDESEKFENAEVRINLIAGLPFYNEDDFKASSKMLDYILKNYSCFRNLHWARLHAQPGAPIAHNAQRYGMYSYASTFDEFYEFSKKNFNNKPSYPALETLFYPYVYYNDDEMNSKVSLNYNEMNTKIQDYKKEKENRLIVYKTLTYRELNSRANRLAFTLRKGGIKQDSIVGLMADNAFDMAIGILAILKAGGAYLPIDKKNPADRISYILENSCTNILLTSSNLAKAVNFSGKIIEMDNEEVYQGDGSNLENINNPKDLAYVIYTSGSTGKSKGIMIEHRNVVNFISWRIKEYGLSQDDTTLQLISLAFDGFGTNFYSSLLTGGMLIIPDGDNSKNYDYIRDVIREAKVTSMSVVPSMYTMIIENAGKNDIKSLKTVILAGEKAERQLIEKSCTINSDITLINEYGPTENTITTTAFIGMTPDKNTIIGKPVGNERLFVLNDSGNIMPVGLPGELCVSGHGLSRGYLNNDSLTQEKFINIKSISDDRIYKTGDFVRLLEDGNLEYIGRIDYQVKIRGFRIELGEIEAQLERQDYIKDVIVIDKENSSGDKYLVAYFISDVNVDISTIQASIEKYLPDYMVPSYFIKLDSMPITPNGKIDRKKLPDAETFYNMDSEYEAPSDETEVKLVNIWKDILDLDTVGVNNKFFQIGGHSLKATALASRIHKEFSVDIPLREIFEITTIKELAKSIRSAEKNTYEAITHTAQKEYYPLSAAQKRIFILTEFEGAGIGYNAPMVLVIEGGFDMERLKDTFNLIIKRHETLRTSFHIIDNQPVQKVHDHVDFDITYSKLENMSCDEKIKDFVKPFDLSKAPLLRVEIVEISSDKSLLLLDMQHIITDGASMNNLLKEITDIYSGKQLETLEIQYRDYTQWQLENLKTEKLKKQENYWLNVFADGIPELKMPYDYQRPSIQSYDGDSISFELDSAMTQKIKKLVGLEGITLNMLFIAVYNVLLSKYSGQEDIIIGLPLAGRGHDNLDNIIGMFVNTLPLRNYARVDMSFRDLLSQVKENSLRVYENDQYQIEDLVEKLKIPRDPSRNPIFDTVFSFQNFSMSNIEGHGIKLAPYELKYKIAKFDFSLFAEDADNTIKFVMDYCIKLFKRETIQRMTQDYIKILEIIADNLDICLKDIDIVELGQTTETSSITKATFNF